MTKRDTIIIVDDMEINRAILRGVFEREYNLLEAENGEQAMLLVDQFHDRIVAMLLDLVMPVKDGYEVMTEIGNRNLLAEFPIVVITAEDSVESEVQAFDLGASDIIMKPFEPHVVKRRVHNIIELNLHKLNQEELIEAQAAKLRESNEVMIDALSSIIEYRSVETGQHIRRIRMFTKILLEDVARSYPEFGLTDKMINIIVSASSMHDIGKIAIPDSILNKPGRLTDEEFEIMKSHAAKGCEILAGLDRMSDREYLQFAYNICRYHHERWDGKGYPDGLKGDSIPVCAQVVGIADCYDALTTDRVYKKAIPPEAAFNMILNGECGLFSPKLLECFKNVRITFAELSKEYADDNLPKPEYEKPMHQAKLYLDDSLDTLQLGQIKYFTLLRYMEATVMEVDLNTGLYHVMYLPSKDFELLKSGNHFSESIKNFVEGAVHPDDREEASLLSGPYMKEFFESGYMKKTRKYRVYSKIDGDYRWCRATVMRIDTGNPRQRKAILIWEELDGQFAEQRPGAGLADSDEATLKGLLGGVQQCLYDQWFTMIQVNEWFCSLLGYKKEEIESEHHNRYLDFIYPADRENVKALLKEQLMAGNTAELEYRIMTKDKGVVWILDKCHLVTGSDGTEYLFSILIDITKSKEAQEELRLMAERHKIIMDQTNDIIFEWDIEKDQIAYSSNWKTRFGYEPIKELASKKILQASHIHPEDLPVFDRLIHDLSGGIPYEEIEFRLADINGRYHWYKIRAAAQFNDMGKPFKAVGVVMDIDEDKRFSQKLQDKAERDELTKLFNKSTARKRIEAYLEKREEEDLSALLIIDVDDFKLVNDRYGHMFGDVVLREIADEMRRLFREGDIIARIGGDEFLIFMMGVTSEEVVTLRAQKVIDAFQRLMRQQLAQSRISCSVGIAFCPRDGESFEALFQRSDMALYEAKSMGKNCYLIFNKDSMDRPFGLIDSQRAANTRIDTYDSPGMVINELIEQSFRKLYESDDMELAISSILELVGRRFQVSRSYIYEDDEDGNYTSNTFEWCNDGIAPQKHLMQHIDYERLGKTYKESFDESGIFYCPDITSLPKTQREYLESMGVKSLLQCAIRDDGGFRGFVGFDDCVIRRVWMREQIDALIFTAKLLSTFLLKKRAQDKAVEMADNLKVILDHQNAWIYVINPETYRLMYINAKTYALAKKAREGMTCYEAFFERNEPCEHCPAQSYKEGDRKTQEVFNPILKVWSSVNVSEIKWENQKAYLLTCLDITPYKEKEETVL